LKREKNMAKCSRCRERKAKRPCPALGNDLCPLCCGILREKKIHCPADCSFLIKHKPYQEKKVIEKKPTFSADILQDERLNWLILNIEAALKEYGERDPAFTDRDAILALEYAKEKVEKGKSALVLPKEEDKLRNDVGEAIFQNIEQCHYQRKIILPQSLETYKKEEKLKCLENIIVAVKYLAKRNLRDRNYIEDLSRRFARIKDASEQKRIISPA
jgi:hypothetical protein